MTTSPGKLRVLARAATATAGAALLFVVSEWLFFVTKPSMFSALGWPERIGILGASALPATIVTASVAIVLGSAAGFVSRRAAAVAAAAPAALIGAATALLLVENFTKTVLGFNIGDVTSPARYLWFGALLLVALMIARRLARALESPSRPLERGILLIVASLGLASAVGTAIRYQPETAVALAVTDPGSDRINLMLLSSDGIDADRMSIYGYERKTTPFLESRRDEFLIFENHLSNASHTAGSNGALLSGKLPTTTGVVQQFDAFQGPDVFQHLPGVLRQMGYYGVQVGARHYIDAYDQNLRQGFHVANERVLPGDNTPLMSRYGRSFPSERYFLGLSIERVVLRMQHAAGFLDMQEVVAPVADVQPSWTSDRGRVDSLLGELEKAPRPFLAHAHFLDTHGPTFRPARHHFSAGRSQSEPWEVDFLDDAINGFDGYVEDIFSFLEAGGELDRTVVVITSDHGSRWSMSARIPLLIRFPGTEPRGSVTVSTQTIDVAPTLLAFLGVTPPVWLEGDSLLAGDLDPHRLLFGTGERKSGFLDALSLAQCQNWFRLDFETGALEAREIQGHTAPCEGTSLLDAEAARLKIMAAIEGNPMFEPPLFVGRRLGALRDVPDPAGRREVVDAVLNVKTEIRILGENAILVRAHWDFWTRGTQPAGVVIQNPGDHPISRHITVYSGYDRQFPVRFFVEDGETTREFVFDKPGQLDVELGPVEGGSARLFIVWTDRAWTPGPRDQRSLGVKLAARS